VVFPDFYCFKPRSEYFVEQEDLHTFLHVFHGKRTKIAVGNVLPLISIPEGLMVCNEEQYIGDRGSFARTSGSYAIIVSHSD